MDGALSAQTGTQSVNENPKAEGIYCLEHFLSCGMFVK